MKKFQALLLFAVMEVANLLTSYKGMSLQVVNVNGTQAVRKSVTYYFSGKASELGATNGKCLQNVKKAEVGITNFQGNQLPKDTTLLITAVRVRYEATGATELADCEFNDNVPPQFANGEFQIVQNGSGVLFKSSGSDVSNRAASTGNDDDFREIVPVLIRSQKDFDFIFSQVGTTAYTGNFKIELRCEEYTSPGSN